MNELDCPSEHSGPVTGTRLDNLRTLSARMINYEESDNRPVSLAAQGHLLSLIADAIAEQAARIGAGRVPPHHQN